MKSKVLIVDDEQDIRELIRFYINKEGYEVIEAKDGEEALEIFESEYIDLCIIDVMMPKMDGFELVENIKEIKDVPCIMLTAKGESKDKLRGFSVGVDDYVVKPFDPNELMARVKAVMRRYDINASNIIMLKDVELDGEKYEIRYKDETIHLPLKQFELLFELAKHPNQIFSREQLIEKIWGMDYDGFDRTVDVHIKRIRENIGHLPGFSVVTVRGLGYKVEVE
ncbi:response regulator transcription factor [[Clostridium] spiroforme]|nr:response regulator transcription factor [Thomasclavelia spiroformis]MBM6880429.1 response regulator transcription factor [Thomasclavelia spiroformis]MBM6930510.1 response regulator transcription factor [Thomasclavelia spiroformis]